MRCCALVLLILSVALPCPALAQTGAAAAPAVSLPNLRVLPGEVVVVRTPDGRVRGPFLSQTADALRVLVDAGPLTIPAADVLRVDVRLREGVLDGLWRGTYYGAMIGSGLGFMLMKDCQCLISAGAIALVLGGIGAGVGAAAGVIADALHTESRLVYRRQSSSRVQVMPLVAPRAAGVRLTLAWGGR